MNNQIAALLLADIRREFTNQRALSERAIAQLGDEEYFHALDADGNSVAVIAKHIGGNLRSRWTDFLTTDGEKPDRHRDAEFLTESDSRASIGTLWQTGWSRLEDTLQRLQPDDLARHVRIRGQEVAVIEALHRSLAHTAQHVGQIIFLAKHLRGPKWQTLSIPRGASAEFLTRPPS